MELDVAVRDALHIVTTKNKEQTMPNESANSFTSLYQLFDKRFFRIPNDQRGYTWTDRQHSGLWDDLSSLREGKDLCVDTIVLRKLPAVTFPEDSFERAALSVESNIEAFDVVDGQQPLTTLVILINELIRFLGDDVVVPLREAPDGQTSTAELKQRFLFRGDETENNGYFALDYAPDTEESWHLQTVVFRGERNGPNKTTSSMRNLQNAATFFRGNIESFADRQGRDAVIRILARAVEHFKFNPIPSNEAKMNANGNDRDENNRNENNDATPAWRDARGVWHPYEGSLKDVRIPRGARVVGPENVGPGKGPFTARKTIRSVSIPEGATELSFRVFWNCSSLERAELPRSLAKIDGDAFLGTSLREIVYAGSVEEFERIEIVGWDALGGGSPIIRCRDAAIDFSRKPFWVKELSFPGTMAEWKSKYRSRGKRPHWLRRQVGIVHCSDGDLRGEPEPGVLAFPEGTGYVPYDLRADRSGVKTACLPASVTAIAGFLDAAEAPFPAHAFDPFPRLREILVDPDNQTFESRDGVLYTKGGRALLYAPDPQRRTFRVPDETSTIEPFAFDACPKLEAFEVSPNHPSLVAFDGVLFSRDARTLVRVPPAWRGSLSFGEDREPVRVSPGAFRGCRGLSGLSFARLPVPAEIDPEAGPEDFSWWFDGLVDGLSLLPGLRTFAVGGGTFDLDAKPPRLRRLEALKTPKIILEKERSLYTAVRRARARRLGPPLAGRG